MSEPLRTPAEAAPVTEAEREALIEKLLLAGLDHYFEGSYEQAVNVWTRVAFLERGHGRARAYIERARGALAERQRQAEEVLHRGIQAYQAGDLAAARDLLTRAVAEGGANDPALVFLQRLGRLQALEDGPRGSPEGPAPLSTGTPWRRSLEWPFAPGTRVRRLPRETAAPTRSPSWFATIVVSAAVAAAILLAAQPIASWLGERPIVAPSVDARPDEPLPIVRPSELQIARARALHAAGRPREALAELDDISPADPLRLDADRLKADVQRALLGGAPAESSEERRQAVPGDRVERSR